MHKNHWNEIDSQTMEGPIVQSIIEDDFYKFTTGQFIFSHPQYRDVQVGWKFKNRNQDVRIGDHISEKDFLAQIESLQKNFQLNAASLSYLASIQHENGPMFRKEYLRFLQNLPFPSISFAKTKDGQLDISWKDIWPVSTHAEIPILRIVSGLFARSILGKMKKAQRQHFYEHGWNKLQCKIQEIKKYPDVLFSDFGNRRTYGGALHQFFIEYVAQELPKQFLGTSKVELAMKLGLQPIGTWPHELSMVSTALVFDGTATTLKESQVSIHQQWLDFYGGSLALSLPDTYGTEFTMNALPNKIIERLLGYRIDSMDPLKAIPLLQKRLTEADIDFRQKTFIPSNELTFSKMIEISAKFKGQGRIIHGIGAGLDSDFDLPKLSIVCKSVQADGKPCVKLSDDPEKTIGDPTEVERYRTAILKN